MKWAPDYNKSKRVNLDTLTKEEVASWKPGETLLLSGKMLTGRDAAHKRIQDMRLDQLPEHLPGHRPAPRGDEERIGLLPAQDGAAGLGEIALQPRM